MNFALPCPSGRCYNGSYWWAWLFQDMCRLGATNGERCTQRDKESNCYWSFVPLWSRRWGVSVALSQVVTWIQAAADAVVPFNIPKEGLQKLGDIHLGLEGCIVTSFLARGMAVSCWCLPSFRSSYKKKSTFLLFSDHSMLHTQVWTLFRPSQNLDSQDWCSHITVLI